MKIAVIGRTSYTKLLKKYLKSGFTVKQFSNMNRQNFSKFKDFDVLVSMTWGKSMWGENKKFNVPEIKKLKLIHLPGSGTDGIDFSLVPRGCIVCNVYEHEIAMSEFIIANLLNWEINLINKINKFKEYNWEDSMLFSNQPHGELFEKEVGILGYGRIGKAVAKKLKAFDAKISVITRKKIKKDGYFNRNILVTDILKTMNKYDYFIVACDLNESTLNLITEKQMSSMNKNCVLVNVARGPIVNEKDLYFALRKKLIRGAIIDTWYKYPKKENLKYFKPSKYNFSRLKNIIMTPHLSALTENLLERRVGIITKNIIAIKNNKKLINVVNGHR
jgi:phosphoglycerate dehydrogenase-like enzyme